MKQLVCILALGLGVIAAPAAPAHADVAAAARAFSDGQAAQLDGNYERAAQSYELAYDIAPSKEALRSAVRARQLANQLSRAAMLAQLLLARYESDPASVKLASEVLTEARGKLGRVSVSCAPECTLSLGGRAISIRPSALHVVFATPGRQVFEVTFDGDRSVTREVTLVAGDEIAVTIEPPPRSAVSRQAAPSETRTSPAPHAGLSIAWTIGGTALTLGLAGATIWSGLDTNKAHDAYVKAPTAQGWTDGRSKQLRTNILLGATGATAAATILIATLWTGGDQAASHEVAVVPERGGATLSFGGSF